MRFIVKACDKRLVNLLEEAGFKEYYNLFVVGEDATDWKSIDKENRGRIERSITAEPQCIIGVGLSEKGSKYYSPIPATVEAVVKELSGYYSKEEREYLKEKYISQEGERRQYEKNFSW